MQSKATYEYAVIRLVPKVEREEFINIGVILFCKTKKYLGIKYLLDKKRIHWFCPDVNLDIIAHHLQSMEAVSKGKENGGAIGKLDIAYRFRWLSATKSTIIQNSKVHPGLCDDPALELEKLYKLYIT